MKGSSRWMEEREYFIIIQFNFNLISKFWELKTSVVKSTDM